MRLTPHEIESIKNSFHEIFKNGKILLFGSRVDDAQKGGDIDLFIVSKGENLTDKKIDFLISVKQKIGDQKIDVILACDPTRLIEQEAMSNGIEL